MMMPNTRPGYVFSDEYMAYRSMINSAVVPPVLTISLSSILSSIAVGCCSFLELEQTYLNDENEMVNKTWNVGLYAYEGYDSIRDDSTECYEYPDRIDPDSSWKSAKTFGVLCGVFAGILAVLLWGWACCRMVSDKGIGQAFTVISLLSTLFCGLTFLFLQSDLCDSDSNINLLPQDESKELINSECNLAWGGKCAISGTVFWFLSILLSFRSKKILDAMPPFDEITLIVDNRTTPLLREETAATDQEVEADATQSNPV